MFFEPQNFSEDVVYTAFLVRQGPAEAEAEAVAVRIRAPAETLQALTPGTTFGSHRYRGLRHTNAAMQAGKAT